MHVIITSDEEVAVSIFKSKTMILK